MTSAVRDGDGGIVALAYVRREVPDNAELRLGEDVAKLFER